MSKINRYKFIKKMYPDYLILLLKNNTLSSFEVDNLIYKYYHNKVFKLNINYIILDNLDIVKLVKYDNNKYYYYSKLVILKELIR